MTERSDPHGIDDEVQAALADAGADRAPAEGARELVADQPAADTAVDEPAREDDQDH